MASALATSTFAGKAVVAKAPSAGVARKAVVTKAYQYIETGESVYDGNWDQALWPNWAEGKDDDEITKLAETELIHGRWAMMGCAGSWAGEVGTGTPWFKAGALCTPADCSAVNSIFPGQVWALGPEGYPSFYNVLAVEVFTMGFAEAYRGGLIDPLFEEYAVGDLHPGGPNFDPLGLADTSFGGGFETMRLAELKHARLAMISWLGYLFQAFITSPNGVSGDLPSYTEGAPGPYANWLAHVADPFGDNLWKYL